MNIEIENLIEEIQEEIDKCINCGMCKGRCPVFQALKEEFNSPRGRVNLLKSKILDKVLYQCSLCKSCEINCPLHLKLPEAFKKARRVMAETRKDPKDNREMINNVRKHGNPFGKIEGKPKKLHCC